MEGGAPADSLECLLLILFALCLFPSSFQDELLSTELLFRGLLSGLSPEEAVALMSALVFQVRDEMKNDIYVIQAQWQTRSCAGGKLLK